MYTIKIKRFVILLLALSVMYACRKIEIKPNGIVSPTEALKTEADLKDALNSAYSPLAGGNFYGGRLQKVSEYLADQADGSGLSTYEADIYNFKSNPNSGTSEIYAEPNVVILRANTVIENLNLVTSGDATKKNYEGQAKFLRAISHFELVRLFAQPYGFSADNTHDGIVVKTTSDPELTRARNTVKEVYDQVIADLKDAETLLPETNGVYPTKWAAKGYLARVYFQMNDFANAYKYSNEVITSNKFTFDNAANFITNRFNNPVSGEAVFFLINESNAAVRFGTLRNDANPDIAMNLPVNATAYQAGRADPNDIRKGWYTVTNSTVYGINKYKKNNFILPLLHLTELKLIRAESAGSLNQNLVIAIQDLNDIMGRAYAGTKSISSTASAALIIATTREQRKLEMIYESGDRLQQIKRIGAKGENSFSGPAAWNCNGLVLQFPASEFNVNANFKANPQGGCTR